MLAWDLPEEAMSLHYAEQYSSSFYEVTDFSQQLSEEIYLLFVLALWYRFARDISPTIRQCKVTKNSLIPAAYHSSYRNVDISKYKSRMTLGRHIISRLTADETNSSGWTLQNVFYPHNHLFVHSWSNDIGTCRGRRSRHIRSSSDRLSQDPSKFLLSAR